MCIRDRNNSGGGNDDTFTENNVSLSANKVSNNDKLNNEFTGSKNEMIMKYNN